MMRKNSMSCPPSGRMEAWKMWPLGRKGQVVLPSCLVYRRRSNRCSFSVRSRFRGQAARLSTCKNPSVRMAEADSRSLSIFKTVLMVR